MSALPILIGAVVGGVLGAFLGRTRVCRRGQCEARHPMIPSILAGAALGAAVGHWLATK